MRNYVAYILGRHVGVGLQVMIVDDEVAMTKDLDFARDLQKMSLSTSGRLYDIYGLERIDSLEVA